MKYREQFFYIGKKIMVFLCSLLVLSVLVFTISRLTPTDPLQSYYGERVEKMSVEEKEATREKLGLNDPVPTQYFRWVQNALQGDFGVSYKYRQPVTQVIRGRIGNTVILGGIGFVITFAGALLLGLLCAAKENSVFDRVMCKVGTLSSCIPEFWLSLVFILLFSVIWRILPSSGAYSIGQEANLADRIRHLIMPMAVVILEHLWYYAYMIRNRLLEETRRDYVLLCKAKGMSRGQIMRRHCLRNIMPTYISLMAISVPHILGGTYIVETVFSYPGIGTLSYESARYGDYNVLMVLGLLCEGTTVIRNAERLRIKESDRIAAMEAELRACGGVLSSEGGTITVQGCKPRLHAPEAPLSGHNDHRVVMSLTVLALAADIPLAINEAEAVQKSWPHFFDALKPLGVEVHYAG